MQNKIGSNGKSRWHLEDSAQRQFMEAKTMYKEEKAVQFHSRVYQWNWLKTTSETLLHLVVKITMTLKGFY
jgi:hypothetical protein